MDLSKVPRPGKQVHRILQNRLATSPMDLSGSPLLANAGAISPIRRPVHEFERNGRPRLPFIPTRRTPESKFQEYSTSSVSQQAKDETYLKGFNLGIMNVGPHKGKTVSVAKPIIKQEMIDAGQACLYFEPESRVMSRTSPRRGQ